MIQRSAILGCGGRSPAHFAAYTELNNMQLVAACDRDASRLEEKGRRFQVPACYTDLDEMLAKEKPDIIHVVAPPDVREGPIEQAGRAGVKGVIVEKPVALDPPQAGKIAALAERYSLKIAVNTQRRYFPSCQGLKALLGSGQIGDITFVRCATKGNFLSMGPHLVDLLQYFMNDVSPVSVWACAHGMNGHDYGHPAPAKVLARYIYANGATAYLEDAEDAVCTPEEPDFWQHLRLDFWGTRGRAWYVQNHSWGHQAEGMADPVATPVTWLEEDLVGQRAFTQAMGDWLEDDNAPHLNCLATNLAEFDMIMATLLSVHVSAPVELPATVPQDIVALVEDELA